MTRLALIDDDQALEFFRALLGAEPARETAIAELIRAEVSARGFCQRATTVRRICRFAAPVVNLDVAMVNDLCTQLEREGDILMADAGLLVAPPLRAIDLGQGRFRLATSLTTQRLQTLLPGSWGLVGIGRTCQAENAAHFRARVAEMGGKVLTPAAWACLDRVPAADQAWLDGLDRRLQATPEPDGSLEHDEPLAWSGCRMTAEGVRWQSSAHAVDACLWRARTRYGYWRHAWCREGPPSTSPFVSCGADAGSRTVFALARVQGPPLTLVVTQDDARAVLTIPHWLPVAEYRYLTVCATHREIERSGSRWSLSREQVAGVLAMLEARLGLVMDSGTGG